MDTVRFLRRLNVAAAWGADVETARSDLQATKGQAVVLAAHAFVWRLPPIALPAAVAVAGGLILARDVSPFALLIAAALGILGPQLVASGLTTPFAWFAALQSWFPGASSTRMPFGVGGFYPYYGFRYAYRGRRRDWSSMTAEERALANPKRAGVGGA